MLGLPMLGLLMLGLGCRSAPSTTAPRASNVHATTPSTSPPGSVPLPGAPEPIPDASVDVPAQLEVLVHAVIVANDGTVAKVLTVDFDPRFSIRVRIKAVSTTSRSTARPEPSAGAPRRPVASCGCG